MKMQHTVILDADEKNALSPIAGLLGLLDKECEHVLWSLLRSGTITTENLSAAQRALTELEDTINEQSRPQFWESVVPPEVPNRSERVAGLAATRTQQLEWVRAAREVMWRAHSQALLQTTDQ